MVAGTVTIQLESADGSDEDLRRLAGWLRDEDGLRGRVDLVAAPVQPGQMGGVLETISVVVTSGTATELVRSLFGWLARRREACKVTLTLSTDTERLDLACGSPEDADKVLKVVREFIDDG